jgi:hypothetical protein
VVLAGGINNAITNDSNPVPELDNFCRNDASYPGFGTYKAMVAVLGLRTASQTANLGDLQKDWVLKANTTYYRRSDSLNIFTTNANAIYTAWPMANGFIIPLTTAWSGLLNNWTYSGSTCSFWTDGTGGSNGRAGYPDLTSSSAIDAGGVLGCNTPLPIICIEQ